MACVTRSLFLAQIAHHQQVTSDIPEGGTALEACLTADGKYVLSGCADRTIRTWSVADGSIVAEWSGHAGVPTCLKVCASDYVRERML